MVNNEKAVVIIDSDDEIEISSTPFTKEVISLDLSDDEEDNTYKNNKTTYLTPTTDRITLTAKSVAESPIRKYSQSNLTSSLPRNSSQEKPPTKSIPVLPIRKSSQTNLTSPIPKTSSQGKPYNKVNVKSPLPQKSTMIPKSPAPSPNRNLPNNKSPVPPSPKKQIVIPERKLSTPTPHSPSKRPTPSTSTSSPIRPSTSSPNRPSTSSSIHSSTSSPNRPSFIIPDKWSSQSSLESRKESRMSKSLLAQAMASKPEPKLSLPRSALLKSSTATTTTTAKHPSSIIKAASSPIKELFAFAISASLKRPIESPERPPPKSLLTNRTRHGSPERSPSQSIPAFGSSSPPASQSTVRASPVRRPSNTIFAPSPTASPPDLRRPKASSLPFSRPEFERRKRFYDIDDEDGEEEDLESFVNVMANTRRRVIVDNTPKKINIQCPVCYMWFNKEDIGDHAAECTGDPGVDNEDNELDIKAGRKRGIRKNTFAAAVALDEAERKRRNKGKIDTGPTNYYADSESILALDGVGFNNEVTGISWESAGQTRFG